MSISKAVLSKQRSQVGVNYGRHYLSDPSDVTSLPKNNKDIDVFLCNDQTRVNNITFQGHGGFAMVLDPEGQIKTKSPYGQVCSSFSQSNNRKRFAGGQFVDGFAGRLYGTIIGVADEGITITVQGETNSGLDIRPPQPPCAFFVQGNRYQINDIVSHNAATATVYLLLKVSAELAASQEVYGIFRQSKYPCNFPSSPGVPCKPIKTASKVILLPFS